eukprot:m.67703 g.67703  ORF g.67703 m.67703 type:complete len:64 (-) comp11590_c0_seq2:38-229(-)
MSVAYAYGCVSVPCKEGKSHYKMKEDIVALTCSPLRDHVTDLCNTKSTTMAVETIKQTYNTDV